MENYLPVGSAVSLKRFLSVDFNWRIKLYFFKQNNLYSIENLRNRLCVHTFSRAFMLNHKTIKPYCFKQWFGNKGEYHREVFNRLFDFEYERSRKIKITRFSKKKVNKIQTSWVLIVWFEILIYQNIINIFAREICFARLYLINYRVLRNILRNKIQNFCNSVKVRL